MTLAKRKLTVTHKELSELFNIPEGVEIMYAKLNDGGDFEFLLVSGEEVSAKNGNPVTVNPYYPYETRRISLKALKPLKEIVFTSPLESTFVGGASGFRINTEGLTLIDNNEKVVPVPVINITLNDAVMNPSKTAQQIAERFAKELKKLTPKGVTIVQNPPIEDIFEQAVVDATKGKKKQ